MNTQTNTLSLGFNAKIKPVEQANKEFARVKIYIAATGKNRNFSYISKEEYDKALPTLGFIPIVAHLYENEDGEYVIGGHDVELKKDDEGQYILKDLTVPFGTVIPDTYNYEDIEEYGKQVTYLTAEAYLWTSRYPDLIKTIYSDDFWFNQSMEINYENSRPYEDDSNYKEILGISFSALCLLQKSDDPDKQVEPCFINSHVEPIQFALEKFSKDFEEMKNELSTYIKGVKFQKEGGMILNKETIETILSEYGLSQEQVNFEITDDMTEEDFKLKLDEIKAVDADNTSTETADFSVTYMQKMESLRNALDSEYEKDAEGNVVKETHYYVIDFDDTYVYAERYIWTLGNSEKTIVRTTYTMSEDGLTATLGTEFTEMVMKLLTKDEAGEIEKQRDEASEKYSLLEQEYADYKDSHSTDNETVSTLEQFKLNIEHQQRVDSENALFEKFDEKLSENEEYIAIKSKCSEYSLEDIEKECLIILGKQVVKVPAKFTVSKQKSVKIPVAHNADDQGDSATSPYGDVYNKYLK